MSADLLSTAALPIREAVRESGRPDESPGRRLRVLDRPAPGRRPRLLYGVIAVAGALAIAGVQMGMSILTTQTSYELKTLTSQQKDLDWQKQILRDDLAGLSSPQYLAANAASLGMITGQTPSYLRLSDAAIVGTGEAAASSSSIDALGKAAVGNALVAGTPLVTDENATIATGPAPAQPDPNAAPPADGADPAAPPADTATPPAITDGLPTPSTH
ncbi:hypothetical protein [Microbacterium telephonicum]|uniref:Cell division protein FtsL n=1 Tax=Microbacterium telephonicum TaxID=1714841 RepID=A0A498C2K7_9MICO|nr:hypothetical protein [Microbacterium telephonicum]RLK49662.1 hypothetical protein C7474_1823 [Microbacterium telephonicum]